MAVLPLLRRRSPAESAIRVATISPLPPAPKIGLQRIWMQSIVYYIRSYHMRVYSIVYQTISCGAGAVLPRWHRRSPVESSRQVPPRWEPSGSEVGWAWLGLAWPLGLAWACSGAARRGVLPCLAWPGVASCLTLPGLAWPGLAWGLAWPGLAGSPCRAG